MTSSNPATAAPALDPVLARAIKKVKQHVLPLFVIMFIVNYIDRVNIGFVRTHMEHDLGIGAAAYGFGAGLFFIGYALFEVPSNLLLQKVGARIWLTRIMFTWGITATLMAFIQNETHFRCPACCCKSAGWACTAGNGCTSSKAWPRCCCAFSCGSGSTPNPMTPSGSAAPNRTRWWARSSANNASVTPPPRSSRAWARCSRTARSCCSAPCISASS